MSSSILDCQSPADWFSYAGACDNLAEHKSPDETKMALCHRSCMHKLPYSIIGFEDELNAVNLPYFAPPNGPSRGSPSNVKPSSSTWSHAGRGIAISRPKLPKPQKPDPKRKAVPVSNVQDVSAKFMQLGSNGPYGDNPRAGNGFIDNSIKAIKQAGELGMRALMFFWAKPMEGSY